MKISQRAANLAVYFARNHWWVLAAALALSILAGWAAAQLPVLTSRQALLPQNTEVAKRFNDFLKNFGAASDLMVVLEGAPGAELRSFADDLAAKLGNEPEIGAATARLDLSFFLKYAYLLLPDEDLDKLAALANSPVKGGGGLEDSLRQALSWSKNPTGLTANADLQSAETSLNLAAFFLEEWRRWLTAETAPASLDWDRLLVKNGAASMHNGYFTSRDGGMVFLFVRPKNPADDFSNLGPFVDKVKQVAAALSGQARAAGRTPPTVGLTGLPAMEYEEHVNISRDIALVIGTAVGLIAALILLVVRSLRWAVLIFIPMGLGVLWSLGLALFTVGHLSIITATFIAILFGLGADYGIFTSSRIAEERRAGKPLLEAIGAGVGSSFIAVLTAGVSSLLIFAALATVEFPGFAELGIVAFKGVLMILLGTWTVQPALYALLPPKLKDIPIPSLAPAPPSPGKPGAGGALPKSIAWGVVVLALGCAILGGLKGYALPFDYDVLALLPKDSQAAYYQRRISAESDYKAEAVIFTAKDMAEARRISSEAAKLKTIALVQSLTGLFPADADERLRKAAGIGEAFAGAGYSARVSELERTGLTATSFELLRALLENAAAIIDASQEQAFSAGHAKLVESLEQVRSRLADISALLAADGGQGRVRSESYLRTLLSEADTGLKVIDAWRQAKPLSPDQLPAALRDRFFAADGRIAIYAFPAKNVYDHDNLDELMKDVYAISPEATGFPSTHQAFSESVVESFAHGTELSLALCLLWIIAATRSMRAFTLTALPLLIGGGWMLGLMALGGIHYNYANMVALPMVIALAVDYGVWFNYRWNELQNRTPWQITLAAGKVIGLAAGTELAGLGAITLASYRGVSSLGLSITIGLLCCLTATLIVDPAIGQLLYPKRKP
jgi:predicted RND superfamily exporter protein